MTDMLKKAREFEEAQEKLVPQELRPVLHFSPRIGWLNDPNGFSYYRGQYHLFYQYYPYDSHWGPMHWGHAVSRDLISWTYLPCALAPEGEGSGGCFSGSAVPYGDGRQLLMYTQAEFDPAVRNRHTNQTQGVALGDGLNYVKYDGNPVLTSEDVPGGNDPHQFRDPWLWKNRDGEFRVLTTGYDPADEYARLLLFGSEDGLHWRFRKVFLQNRGKVGRLWECPSFFPLGDRWALIASAMFMQPKGELSPGNGAFGLVGTYEEEMESFRPESIQAVDGGIDFYAAQVLKTADGRTVMIAWMMNQEISDIRSEELPIHGQMIIPRELSLRDGRICQRPVRELDLCRQNRVQHQGVELSEAGIRLPGIRGRILDLELCIHSQDAEEISIRFAEDSRFYTECAVLPRKGRIRVDRSRSGTRNAALLCREADLIHTGREIRLRIVLDRWSAEIFINDGEQVMTLTFHTELTAQDISFRARGQAKIDVTGYTLDPTRIRETKE